MKIGKEYKKNNMKQDNRNLIVCENRDCPMFGIEFNPNEGTYFDPILETDCHFGEKCFKCEAPYIVKR